MLLTNAITALVLGCGALPPTTASQPSAGARRIVAECDLVVVARVAAIREFTRASKTRAADDPLTLRIAELVLDETWCGFAENSIHVRLSPGWSPPEGTLVWGLEPARGFLAEDWQRIPGPSGAHVPTTVWQRRESLGAPWSPRVQSGRREIEMPSTLAAALPAMGLASNATPSRRWVDVEMLRADLALALATSCALRVEVVSNGPYGIWSARIDDQGQGVMSDGRKFVWSEAQRAIWREALERSRFGHMPPTVGQSTGPCLSSATLTAVTRAGRRTVRTEGGGPNDDTVAAREEWTRLQALWRTLEGLLPGLR